MIAILDYGGGNVGSVRKAIEYLGAEVTVASRPEEIRAAAKLILPGQGHFGAMMKALGERGLVDPIREGVAQGRPMLGICLGLQALYESSEEAPGAHGLGLLEGRVRRFEGVFKVPHIGWSPIEVKEPRGILRGIPNGSFVYFCHSYYAPLTPETSALTDYGQRLAAAAEFGSVAAVQFHPEKSGDTGLQILRNFIE